MLSGLGPGAVESPSLHSSLVLLDADFGSGVGSCSLQQSLQGLSFGTQTTFQHRQAPAVPAGAGLGEQYCMHGWQDARFFLLEIAYFLFAGLSCMKPFLYIFLPGFFSQGCTFLFVSPKKSIGFCG